MKTPEQMAEEYGATVERVPIMFCKPEEPCKKAFLAGYQAAKDQFADTGKVMNSSNNSNSWISVKERLPDRDQEVLGYEKPFISTCLFWKSRSFLMEHQWELSNGRNCNPTHWMPLPEAPTEE